MIIHLVGHICAEMEWPADEVRGDLTLVKAHSSKPPTSREKCPTGSPAYDAGSTSASFGQALEYIVKELMQYIKDIFSK
jgi:hypothetical protein